MTTRLQRSDFQNNPYERPSDRWVCGNAAQGKACRLGPSGTGRCRTRYECDPERSGDNWICTRPETKGGLCGKGPRPDGTCCRKVAPCVPLPALRRWRGKLTFWVTAATLGVLALGFGTPQGIDILHPGAVIHGHAEAGDCGTCHVAFEPGSRHWALAAFRSTDPVADSKKCLACHKKGDDALSPHNLPVAQLEERTRRVRQRSESAGQPLLMSISEQLFERPGETTGALACATCHKDHKGADFQPVVVSNARCQSCHKVKFASLADGHPSFGDYPYTRRPRLAFDHYKHFRRNFSEAKSDEVPETCATCHLPDSSGRFMLVQSFEETCVACHRKDIEGETVAGPKGIAVFSVPGLDRETLAERGFEIGEWPELALADEVTPFMRLLLAVEPQIAVDLARVVRLDLQDLREASDRELGAVRRIAWAIKELLYDFTILGADTIQARLQGRPELRMDRESLGRLLGHIPLDVVRAARRSWFPRLKREISHYRETKAASFGENLGRETGPWRAGRAGTLQIALAVNDGAIASDADRFALLGAFVNEARREQERGISGRILLAQAGESLLSGSDDLLDKKSLRIEDLDALLKEDSAADNSIFKAKRSPAGKGDQSTVQKKEPEKPESSEAAPSVAVAEEAEEEPEAESEADREPEKAAAQPAPVPSTAAAEKPADEPAAEPVELADEGVEQAADDADIDEALDPNLNPEVWARLGGWYRQDDTLYYRPVEHCDPFLRTWYDIGAALHGSGAQVYGARILALFRDKNTPGKCTRCHSIDKQRSGQLKVNWSPFAPDPRHQDFSVFDHTAHFSLVEKKGCSTCHEIDAGANFPEGYKDFDAGSFTANFAPMDQKVCSACHKETSAGDACVMCHRYHIGEFPITPVKTLIAGLPAAGAAPGRGPTIPSALGSGAPGSALTDSGLPWSLVPPSEVTAERAAEELRAGEWRAVPGERFDPPSGSPRDQDRSSLTARLEQLGSLHSAEVVLQLSSFPSLDAAKGELLRLKDRFAALLGGKNLIVQRIDQERQGIFYRVLARPFSDLNTAEAFCIRLKSWEQDCLILHENLSSAGQPGPSPGGQSREP